jgi:hypothetical protein
MTGLRFALGVTAALIAGSVLMQRAEATPLTRALDSLAVLRTYSQVQMAGCVFGTSPLPGGHQMDLQQVPSLGRRRQEVLLPDLLGSAGDPH